MTLQEIFDKSVRTIIQQGGPSIGTNGAGHPVCKYRNPEGRVCAAGALISDEDYLPNMEGRRFRAILPARNFDQYQTDFIGSLQTAHDGASTDHHDQTVSDIEFFREWKPKLRTIALRFGVEPTVLEEIPT